MSRTMNDEPENHRDMVAPPKNVFARDPVQTYVVETPYLQDHHARPYAVAPQYPLSSTPPYPLRREFTLSEHTTMSRPDNAQHSYGSGPMMDYTYSPQNAIQHGHKSGTTMDVDTYPPPNDIQHGHKSGTTLASDFNSGSNVTYGPNVNSRPKVTSGLSFSGPNFPSAPNFQSTPNFQSAPNLEPAPNFSPAPIEQYQLCGRCAYNISQDDWTVKCGRAPRARNNCTNCNRQNGNCLPIPRHLEKFVCDIMYKWTRYRTMDSVPDDVRIRLNAEFGKLCRAARELKKDQFRAAGGDKDSEIWRAYKELNPLDLWPALLSTGGPAPSYTASSFDSTLEDNQPSSGEHSVLGDDMQASTVSLVSVLESTTQALRNASTAELKAAKGPIRGLLRMIDEKFEEVVLEES